MRTLALALTTLVLVVPGVAAQTPPVADINGVTITQTEFDHWLRIAHISSRPGRGAPLPRAGTKQRRELEQEVMELLVQNVWVTGEAGLRGIVVTERQVDRRYAEQKRLSFPRERDYRRFLRSSGFTAADIRFRIRLDETSHRLREQVTSRSRDPDRQQALLDAFVVDFRRRWRSVTVCRAAYATEDCGRTIP